MNIDFDEDRNAIINPFGYCTEKLPNVAVACYSNYIIDKLISDYNGYLVCKVSKTPIYVINYKEEKITVFKSPIGASWASMVMEDLISLGINKFIYFGSCGVLDNTDEYEILIPIKSLREEGTSYHYIKEGKYIDFDFYFQENFINILKDYDCQYKKCIAWTTDAPYRETKAKVKKFLEKNILCVDMESSALTAIAKFRNVNIFIFFYSADKLSDNKWDKRCLGSLNYDKKMFIASLALDLACSNMEENDEFR